MNLPSFLLFALVLFCLGLYGVLARRNLIGILIGVELMLNAASVNFMAFHHYSIPDPAQSQVVGPVIVLFIIGLAAAEAAIALAIILNVYRHRSTIDVDAVTELRG